MDEKAEFEKYYKDNKSFIISVLRRYIRNQQTVEDLAQQTFINAWVGRRHFEGRSTYRTWLYRIAVNVTFTHLLKERQKTKVFTNNLDMFESDATSLHYLYITPMHVVGANEDLETLKSKMQQLPKDMQQALVMYAIYGVPYEEIAQSLNIPIGTVRSRIHRARALLAESVGYLLDE